ncbi:DnaJ domain-containing protein/RRM_6 domain-containing protein [Cephalotus follicularis]|uniref:DnaJ domain-containing protein/RRM_6 domain-containing protein n=1 Tax=Cephalotus follicularis TaxID=3775 RepID=A0A1Q3CAH5_CEPFO|nr:DnaJ domain-containing protein/RRM_6 domain-containing protein [Cephalotus follicularis]
MDVDHYSVLGLPSGEEGAKLTEKEISKAYKLKALELHPDKRPDDPSAHDNFQKLKTSYEVLKDEKARKLFDDLLKLKREHRLRQSQQGSKRRKMMSDLEERERAAFAPDLQEKAREEEEKIARKLREEIARIRELHLNRGAGMESASKRERGARKESADAAGIGLDKAKVLKVSWEKIGGDYSAERLRELFLKFGEVEDVVIKSSKNRGSALVVMGSKDAAVAATGCVSGSLFNPLLVVPLQPAVGADFQQPVEPDQTINLVGARYQAHEDAILAKLQKAAKAQK